MDKSHQEILDGINNFIRVVDTPLTPNHYPSKMMGTTEWLIAALISTGWSHKDATLYVDNIPFEE